ncbi:MAG: PDZ domain-containing protein [Akkermansiaceae bacterium]|nr:PDZ domain-containing protein [Akkermansiaceae bacterium]
MKEILTPLLHLTATVSVFANTTEFPGLVRIESYDKIHVTGENSAQPVNRSLGFIVEKDGFLLTNYKNLTNPSTGNLLEDFHVTLTDGSKRTFTASVIGVEPTINLGILKIGKGEDFAVAKIGRAKEVAAGNRLSAVAGFEDGKIQITQGEVAGLNTRECYQESLTSTMFRATISVTESSVGGPVVLSDTNEVVAIYTGFKPTADKDHQEVGGETHLLPINLCFNIYDSIKQKGSLKSPWTGFSVRPLNDSELKFFPTAKKHNGGIAIEHVWPDSPAAKLGLRVNDILVQFSYNRILAVADFQKWLYMYGVGHPVKLMILRNGQEYLVADYVIEERPQSARPK